MECGGELVWGFEEWVRDQRDKENKKWDMLFYFYTFFGITLIIGGVLMQILMSD